MKHVMSVSLDEDTIIKIREILRTSSLRNKSHVVEEAIKEFWKGGRDD
jgi:hypothetical protein